MAWLKWLFVSLLCGRPEFDARLGTPWRLLVLSREAMKIQDDRQMMKDERVYYSIV